MFLGCYKELFAILYDYLKETTISRYNNNNNSILYHLSAESTATRPITDTAQCRYK
jgi:hypothetical protein